MLAHKKNKTSYKTEVQNVSTREKRSYNKIVSAVRSAKATYLTNLTNSSMLLETFGLTIIQSNVYHLVYQVPCTMALFIHNPSFQTNMLNKYFCSFLHPKLVFRPGSYLIISSSFTFLNHLLSAVCAATSLNSIWS